MPRVSSPMIFPIKLNQIHTNDNHNSNHNSPQVTALNNSPPILTLPSTTKTIKINSKSDNITLNSSLLSPDNNNINNINNNNNISSYSINKSPSILCMDLDKYTSSKTNGKRAITILNNPLFNDVISKSNNNTPV